MSFQTTVVGSYTRPDWLLEGIKKNQPNLAELITHAKLLSIKEQELAGIDVITDGEQGRTSFIEYLDDTVENFRRTVESQTRNTQNNVENVSNEINLFGESPSQEVKFLRANTKRDIKINIPSASLIAFLQTNVHKKDSKNMSHNRFPEVFEAVSEETRKLSNIANHVQIDAPELTLYTDPEISNQEAREGIREDIELINEQFRKTEVDKKVVHICWGNIKSTHLWDGDLIRIYPELLEIEADQLSIELAHPNRSEDSIVFKEYPSDKEIAAGVIDVKSQDIELVRVIKKRVESIINSGVSPKKLWLTTDCGFAPTWDSITISRDTCFKKLQQLNKAAEDLRKEYE